ncbi:MAG: UbiA family prenyltransferase [Lentisphaerales bacterium]|nr:UbiA family prenyltransferase [Lentisphaerales bacterium]
MNLQGSRTKKLATPLPALFDFSLYSNLFVASITSLASYYWQVQNELVSLHYLAFLFFATLFIYNLEHSQLKKRDFINKPKRSLWLQNNQRKVQIISLFAFVAYFGLFLYEVDQIRSISTLSMLLVCLLYCSDRFLKKTPLVKNALLALIWSTATVLMPYLWLNSIDITNTAWLVFTVYFIASFCNSLLSDWNDIKGDLEEGLISFSSRINKQRLKAIILTLSMLLFTVAAFSITPGFCLTALSYAILAFRKQNSEVYTYDFCLVLPLLFMAIP